MVQWPKQRAWGWYATLIRTPWFCLKLLRFKPYGALSVQRHFCRTELWYFLKGCGQLQYCNILQPFFYKEKELYIPYSMRGNIVRIRKKMWHQFTALDKPVYVLELQYGRKVTESDIERK